MRKPLVQLAILVFACLVALPGTAPAGQNGAPDDLWEVFCAAPRLPVESDAEVERAARRLTESAQHFRDLLYRAEPWMWFLVRAVGERGMPMDLAAVPAVESAFHPRAQSSRTAGGFWQFVPATARTMNLRIDDHFDARSDIEQSTRAALDYLQYLHGRFDSWQLALAAYNAGEARLVRAMAGAPSSKKRRVQPSDLPLPAETLNYLVRLQAFARAVCAPEDYGVQRPALPARPLIASVAFNRRINLEEAAGLARTPLVELEAINPALHTARTPPRGPHQLWLPAHRVDFVHRAVARRDDLEILRYGIHEVVRGDTLSRIAARHRASVDELVQLNALSNHRIRIGDKLRVPLSDYSAH